MISVQIQGHKGQFAPCCRALDTIITKSYHGSRRLSTRLVQTTLNTSSLGLRGIKIKDPVVGATWLWFHLPARGWGGGGGVERDQISDIRSLIRYHAFAKNQISGLKNQISETIKNQIIRYHTPYKIKYQVTPMPPPCYPPPPSPGAFMRDASALPRVRSSQ